MAALGVNNKLETLWEDFASDTDVFLGNFGPLNRSLQIPPKILPNGFDQLLRSSSLWSFLPWSIFGFSSLLIPLKGSPNQHLVKF